MNGNTRIFYETDYHYKKKMTQKMLLNDDGDKFCELHVNSENSDQPYKATTCDFQQCDIFTSVDSDKPVQPLFGLRNSK